MKNIMRRTVAFMLMACLLLSVMAPTAFAETTDEVTYAGLTYNLVSGDGKTYYSVKKGSTLPADKTNAETGEIEVDYEVLDNTKTYQDGDWQLIKYSNLNGITVGPSYINGNVGASGRNIVLKLNDITTPGKYDIVVSLGRKQSTAVMDAYLFPGSTDTGDISTTSSAGKKIGTVQSYTTATQSVLTTVEITEEHIKDTNSCIIAFYGTLSSNANFSPSKIELIPHVTLTKNVNQNITLKDGAVLDLNGYTVTGDVTVVNGQIVDSGATKGSVDGTLVATGNKWLPIKNTDGTYSFYEATAKEGQAIYNETDNSVTFWFDLDMESDAYAKVLAGDFNIGANLTVGGKTYEITGMEGEDGAVTAWLDSNGIYGTDGDGALCVKITNLNVLTEDTEIILTPVFENLETSVSGMFGGAISYTYEVPAAAE